MNLLYNGGTIVFKIWKLMKLPEIKRNLDIYIESARTIVKKAIDEAYTTIHSDPTYAENAIIEAKESLNVILEELEKFRDEI